MTSNQTEKKKIIVKQVIFNPPFDILKKKANQVISMTELENGGFGTKKNG